MIAAMDRVNGDERLPLTDGGTYIVWSAEAVARALDNQCRHGDAQQVRYTIASSAGRLEWIPEDNDTVQWRRVCRPQFGRSREVRGHAATHRLAANQ
jgi:hypothetical protein